ncbi:hypothetical protein B0H17DRAFT_1133901 [Mycena rosella]|uniref:Uncharacterized protein n=1 Tax=Mycena rosella TaxID=1033263 RepID=A0AAD7GJP4_MYCRO|nr:hypothetical protein B0H17DRAFT_1133901 [Mycena rosella]
MPRTRKRPSTAQRGSDGMFISNHQLPPSPDSGSEDGDSDDKMAWESASDLEPEDLSYSEAWQDLPLPMTVDEQVEKCAAQRKRAEEKPLGARCNIPGPEIGQKCKGNCKDSGYFLKIYRARKFEIYLKFP